MPRVGSGLTQVGGGTLDHAENARDPFRSGKDRVGTFVTHATDVSDGGAPMTGRLGIDDVTPSVGDGRHPSKAVVGEVIPIGATVWREGHDAVAANVVWRKVGSRAPAHHVRMEQTGAGHRPLRGRRRRRRAGAVDVPRRRVERPLGHVAQRRHQEARRGPDPRGARQRPGDRRPAAAAGGPPPRPSARTATCSSARPTRCATPRCRCTPGSRPRCSRPCTRS